MNDAMDFSDMDEAFRGAESNVGGDFDPIPDGSYQAIIDGVQFKWLQPKDAQYSPSRIFEWTFKIISGPLRNRKIWKTAMIRPELLKWLKTDCWRCGLHIQTLTELDSRKEKLLDTLVEVKLETKTVEGKNRQNVYIQRVITTEQAPTSSKQEQAPPLSDDDIPF
jgi:hypothetical protein